LGFGRAAVAGLGERLQGSGFIDLSIAVVINVVADLRAWGSGGGVALSCRPIGCAHLGAGALTGPYPYGAASAHIKLFVYRFIAVVIHAVAEFRGAGINIGISVVTVLRHTRPVPVCIRRPHLICPDIAAGYAVAIAILGPSEAALVGGGAARVGPGIDGRAAGQQGMGLGGTVVVRQWAQVRVLADDVSATKAGTSAGVFDEVVPLG
jgi:hypothetical protein